MATNGNFNHQDQYKSSTDSYAVTSGGPQPQAASGSNSNLSKDEVGWYFVEQYYTTLSKSPEKLHLFYSKRSQFVYGMEAEVSPVAVGRTDIQDRIKELDFQDCKVRISNVDSQASFENIVIQVIGETSIKQGEPKKFVQTFVLAQQPSGYFVLNDILRYVNEEGDEEPEETQEKPAATEPESAAEPAVKIDAQPAKAEEPVEEPTPVALDTTIVDKKLEEVSTSAKDAVSSAAGTDSTAESVKGDAVSKGDAPAETAPDPDLTSAQLAEDDAKATEKPKEPTTTPVTTIRASAPAAEAEKPAPVPAPAPPKPLTWANRAAAAAGPPRPVVPLPKTATPPAPGQTRAPAPAAAPVQPAPATQAAEPAAKEQSQPANEWQTAGSESKRQNRPQSVSGPPQEKEGTMAYIKYVTEKVKTDELRNILAGYGELTYFDINRQKNCAFVEFATAAGYQAAAAANPHVINGENIIVEPRRPKSTAYGGSSYGSGRVGIGRGGSRGGGSGVFEGNRSGSSGGRGTISGPGRGRGGASRGRGAAQTGTA